MTVGRYARAFGSSVVVAAAPVISGTISLAGSITWAAVSGATSYVLYRDGVSAGTIASGYTPVGADLVALALTVKSVNAAGSSVASNALAFAFHASLKLRLNEVGLTVVTGYSDWANQASLGSSFSQAATGSQPATGATINGYAAPLADGIDDSFGSSLVSGDIFSASAHHIWCVFNSPVTGLGGGSPDPVNWPPIIGDNGFGYFCLAMKDATGGVWHVAHQVYDGAQKKIFLTSANLATNQCVEASHGAGNLTLRLAGVDAAPVACGNFDATGLTKAMRMFRNFAGTNYLNAKCHLYVFNTQLGATDQADMRAFMAARYGVAT